jgi:hypothetical protein
MEESKSEIEQNFNLNQEYIKIDLKNVIIGDKKRVVSENWLEEILDEDYFNPIRTLKKSIRKLVHEPVFQDRKVLKELAVRIKQSRITLYDGLDFDFKTNGSEINPTRNSEKISTRYLRVDMDSFQLTRHSYEPDELKGVVKEDQVALSITDL